MGLQDFSWKLNGNALNMDEKKNAIHIRTYAKAISKNQKMTALIHHYFYFFYAFKHVLRLQFEWKCINLNYKNKYFSSISFIRPPLPMGALIVQQIFPVIGVRINQIMPEMKVFSKSYRALLQWGWFSWSLWLVRIPVRTFPAVEVCGF